MLKKNLLITLFFLTVIVMIMSPIASHDAAPFPSDLVFHLANIAASRTAFLQGQFPLRVATELLNGWVYPIFQFYGPTLYTLTALMSFVILHNPWNVYKFTLGLALLIGSWYNYKFYLFLFKNERIALLGSVLYLFSPYLLLNLNLRGDMPEVFAEALIPALLYYAFRLFYAETSKLQTCYFMILLILVNYCILTSHLISFATTTLFLGLLFLIVAWREKRLHALLPLILSLAAALLLAAWYLGPILLFHRDFHIANQGNWGSPWDTSNLFTLLPTLLAPKAVIGSPALLSRILPAIGLLITLSVGYWLYIFALTKEEVPHRALVQSYLILFLLALILTWSPFNFWPLLPHSFYFIQFTFRFCTDLMWLGGILFVALLAHRFKETLKIETLLALLIVIGLCGSSWLQNNYQTYLSVHAFNLNSFLQKNGTYYPPDYPLSAQAFPPGPYDISVAKAQASCQLKGDESICQFNVSQNNTRIQLPVLYYPWIQNTTVNGQKTASYPSLTQSMNQSMPLVTVLLQPGNNLVKTQFTGWPLANDLSRVAWGLYLLFILICLILRHRAAKPS